MAKHLACFLLELIWKYGSHRHLEGLLGPMISPVARPLPTQDNTNIEDKRTDINPRVGFEPKNAVFE
jgi:hypothetical protein